MSDYVHDMRQVLVEVIDEKIPDPVVPASIVLSYLKETLAQEGGRELLGSLVSPGLGKTVGTALVEFRHYRLFSTMKAPSSLLAWLGLQDVDLNVPDAHGDTAFFKSLFFEVPRLTGSIANLDAVSREVVFDRKHMEAIFSRPGLDPLLTDGNGFGFLQCEGQGFAAHLDGLDVIRSHIQRSLEAIRDPIARWETVLKLEQRGVAELQKPWWNLLRSTFFQEFLTDRLPNDSHQKPSRRL